MKASEVLRRYKEGERDFCRVNLRGQSFKGQNLSGADFSYADIRSTNFSCAKLQGANFTGAKAGLQKRWALILLMLSWFLSVISFFLFLHNESLIMYTVNLSASPENKVTGWVALIVTIIVYIVIINQGIEASLVFVIVIAIVGAGARVFVGVIAFAGATAFAKVELVKLVVGSGAFGAFAGVVTIIEVFVGTVAFAGAATVAGAKAGLKAGAFAGSVTITVAGIVAGAIVVILAIVGAIISSLIAYQAIKENDKYTLVRNFAVAFAAIGGTSFRAADLTDANFTSAQLKSTDLRGAKLIRTCFNKTKLLNRVRPGTSYLQHPQICKLLSTRQGQDKNFDRLDLRGINLKAALLTDVSFIGADLSEACLQDADLSRAQLVQTQLDRTDFTGAILTGAYIEDWGITNETRFHEVRCEYVHMRFPTTENPDPWRKPNNKEEVFADGEFSDFIKPLVDTLDLYHNSSIDPRAIAISFKELAENNPDAELEIVAMEKRGKDKFLLRAKTAPLADKSQLSAEYFEIYNQVKALAEKEVQTLMAEKDNRIRSLENFVNTALKSPSSYSNTQIEEVSNMNNNPGGLSVGGNVGGNVNNVQGDNNRAVQGDNNQGVLGDNNQVTQQNQVDLDADTPLTKEDVVKLLAKLEALVKTAELSAETKEEVVEDLSAAKKATDKEDPKKNIALANLESVAQTLEKTSKTVDAGQKLWNKAKPIITKIAGWLGAAASSYLLKL
ncbi:pentapeptide repeat-containing protein [Mastigocoleus sp. MO_188.B34]|uniref:pentapeptide repeat-containing protein n=1 Tax=Mastigocoleus sp. MO_188.B34 TaxID=3036635 RepID=UPI00262FCD3C|nr:pentapeptide repeat-containing protein [Mastigocoleus sp. MO_188.B34]MDJ0696485.1 pentapeptide repeat-containing protein [Mastigocoleus sp. MO_188.B34]